MPIFEYACNDCTVKRFSALVGVVASATPPTCPKCGSANLRKLVSRFSRLRSEDEALDQMADMAESIDEDDPRAVRRLMKEMAHGLDDDVSGDELEAMMDESMDAAAGDGGGEDATE